MFTPDLDHKPGETLDHFRLDAMVATGGMATVYAAHDLNTGRKVAIKIPHPEAESDPVLWERFRREEEIGTRIDHPGVMKVLANPGRSQVYMVMEWVEGRLLRALLNEATVRSDGKVSGEQKRLTPERAVRLTVAMLHALEHVHAAGVVHRDLKPENIMVGPDDDVHLIDFGIAGSAGARRLTFAHFSQSMGTPDYISPEQVKGRRGDARSDLYAAGVMLYEMVTGQVPFSGSNPFAVMNDRLLNQPIPPRKLNPEITPQLQEILYRALEREPRNRYPSAREMVHDLENQQEVGIATRTAEMDYKTRHSPGRRRVLLIAGLAMIPIAVFAVLLLVAHRR